MKRARLRVALNRSGEKRPTQSHMAATNVGNNLWDGQTACRWMDAAAKSNHLLLRPRRHAKLASGYV